VTVREVVIDADEVVAFDTVRVTDTTRTVVDIVRFAPVMTSELALMLQRLATIGGVSQQACRGALERRKNLPNKTLAWQRIVTLGLAAD
jgi:hypothetical protein